MFQTIQNTAAPPFVKPSKLSIINWHVFRAQLQRCTQLFALCSSKIKNTGWPISNTVGTRSQLSETQFGLTIESV